MKPLRMRGSVTRRPGQWGAGRRSGSVPPIRGLASRAAPWHQGGGPPIRTRPARGGFTSRPGPFSTGGGIWIGAAHSWFGFTTRPPVPGGGSSEKDPPHSLWPHKIKIPPPGTRGGGRCGRPRSDPPRKEKASQAAPHRGWWGWGGVQKKYDAFPS